MHMALQLKIQGKAGISTQQHMLNCKPVAPVSALLTCIMLNEPERHLLQVPA